MVTQVLADVGQFVEDVDEVLGQLVCGADAGQHEDLGRVEGAG